MTSSTARPQGGDMEYESGGTVDKEVWKMAGVVTVGYLYMNLKDTES